MRISRSPFFTTWLSRTGTLTTSPVTSAATLMMSARTRPSRVHGVSMYCTHNVRPIQIARPSTSKVASRLKNFFIRAFSTVDGQRQGAEQASEQAQAQQRRVPEKTVQVEPGQEAVQGTGQPCGDKKHQGHGRHVDAVECDFTRHSGIL